ncbi:hypothetical protein CH371_02135 [Leptospira wolffii]|uniref:Lipoprotein n=1 Tax=Leptospira wolffii TaxID=409998 RepID=A0A2M9ZES6_9LEPT|nr:hypothetical protein [Leptospira wolffii]PJZ66913.1 hypothetical protein CH371_02135 [Leptospira wolffii]
MKFLTLFPFLLLILQCTTHHPAAADYFEKYFTYQEVIQNEVEDEDIRSIIYGNPESDGEDNFHEKDGKLLLSLRLFENGGKFGNEISGSPFALTPFSPYTVSVEAKKNEFRKKNTYKIKRTVEMISPEVSVFDVFPVMDESVSKLRKADLSQVQKFSEVQKFLCENFDCSISKEEGILFLRYTLSERMRERFPQTYKKLSKRLDQVAFRFQIFQPGGFSKGIEVYNEKRTIILGIPDFAAGHWSHPKSIHIRSYFYVSILGLKVDIRGLGYTFRFSRSGNTDIVSGEFTKIPETNIGGRFLSVFPPGMVNFFIPEDMNQYADDSFELMVKGSEADGGNRFQTKTIRNGNKTKVILTSESEIFRDRFLPFKSKDRDDEPGFFSSLGKALIRDLRGK